MWLILIYTSKFINIVSLIISVILYVFMNFFINDIHFSVKTVQFKADFISQENLIQNNHIYSNSVLEEENKKVSNNNEQNEWYIQIDNISLKAPIQEGTTKEILENYIGHFEESSRNLGNICLAAHNRGYKNNYFSRIKELKEGDEIIYRYKEIERKYAVTKHEIIENTDWSNLESTEENRITLITCVENEPKYRRCIQGIEKR